VFPTTDDLPAAVADAFGSASLPRAIQGLVREVSPWPEAVARRSFAVVMLFVPPAEPGGSARIVLTRRSTKLRSHRGQIGFAGGRMEPSDPSPVATALRELHEELGVPPDDVTPLGLLANARALDAGLVVPIVAVATTPLEAMRPAPDEVESVFAEPWTSFQRERDREFRFNIFGNWRQSHLYQLPGRAVWGLTANILYAAELG
jgi:8-oxo-dGTP pyrophosphatase MutT (NUDIX family)